MGRTSVKFLLKLTACFLLPCVRELRLFVALRFFDVTSSSESEPCTTEWLLLSCARTRAPPTHTDASTDTRARAQTREAGDAYVKVFIIRIHVDADIVCSILLQLVDPLLAHALLVCIVGSRDI